MSKLDAKQQEAIRTLARLTATRSGYKGSEVIDPFVENEEKGRVSRYIKSGFTKNTPEIDKDYEFYAWPIRILFLVIFLPVIAYGIYGLVVALMNA